jgi:FtsP/CotA-like multicopper oxidase with cupredoxin domain
VHLHGGDVPADSDGHPLDLIPPGGTKEYFYPGLNPAAPLWYHDHAVHETGRNVYMVWPWNFIVTDAVERALPLPKGQFDIPLTIMDKFFLRDRIHRLPDTRRPHTS